jgi:hypothetical protein
MGRVTGRPRSRAILSTQFTSTIAEGIMFPSVTAFSRFTFAVIVVAGSGASALAGQDLPRRRWTVTAGFTGLRTSGQGDVVYGPELGIRRDFGPRWGVELRASVPTLDADEDTDDGAGAIDVGPTLTFAKQKTEFGLSGGATLFIVGHRGELADGGIGGFIAGHATAWLNESIGAVAGANLRVSGRGNQYPGLSAGLAVRF